MGEIIAKPERATDSLFPILGAPAGIARLVAEATHLRDGHHIVFRSLAARSILNKSVSKRQLSLAWSINPYRGCEFACRYCYARYTHEFLRPDLAPDADGVQGWATSFERDIYLKDNAAWLLRQDLRAWDRAGHSLDEEIGIGTATDPYQPVERTARVTQSLLEVFAGRGGHRLGIITKSPLIVRDLELLRAIAKRNTLVVHVTVTTADAQLARRLEPRAPRPDLRLDAVHRLRAAGLTAGVLCSPLLPGLTDGEAAIDSVAAQAAKADASFFCAQPLFLKSCSRPTYLSFVREHYPALLGETEQRFAQQDFADAPYRALLASRVSAVCRRHRLRERSSDALLTRTSGSVRRPPASVPQAQQRLFA